MELILGLCFVVLFYITFSIIDELVKNHMYLKKENKNLFTIVEELKTKNSEELMKELNKMKKDNENFEKYIKDEIKEIFESIRFTNDEIVHLKDKFVKSSRVFEIQSLDLKCE